MAALIGFTKTRLNMREGPGAGYLVLAILPKGARLEIVEDMGDWLNVVVEGVLGYVHEDYVRIEAPPRPVSPARVPEPPAFSGSLRATTKTRVNLRSGPGLEFPIVRVLPPGSPLRVLEDLGEWLNVMSGASMAYVNEAFVDVEAGPEADPPPDPPVMGPAETVAEVLQAVEMRAGAGETYAALDWLTQGDLLLVVEDLGDWVSVTMHDRVGYLPEKAVRLKRYPVIRTTRLLHMYAGPGFESSLMVIIPENETLVVLKESGEWKEVQYETLSGYITEGPVQWADPDIPDEPPVQDVESRGEGAREDKAPDWLEMLLENTRQRYGGALDQLSAQFNIEPAAASAVVAVECGRTGLNPDGSLVLRFEVHLFWQYWGVSEPDVFARHFRFDPASEWQGHEFRADPEGPWGAVHDGQQESEQQAYQLAATLNRAAARLSSALGAPQIMGFNFRLLGYESVDEMYDAFRASEVRQLRGFFDMMHGGMDPADGIAALREKDFEAFARYYHGEDRAEKYAGLIRRVYRLARAD